ncbi:gamma-aminobutyric acid type B receptor subunit 2-like [Asterias amurensis]|uniref:gamma-aminobutyric acid type B receptor subunit 2-like n=1 Tax=Asterias amurensis TaxID=7602 RepID=UPI003AB294CC
MKGFKRYELRVASLMLLALSAVLTTRFTAASSSHGPNGTVKDTNNIHDLYIGGFFSFPSLDYQPLVAQTAIDHINSLQGILDGYHLEMRWNWTGNANPAQGLRLLHTLVNAEPPIVMAWGPLYSIEATILNQVAGRYNLVQVGLATSEALLDRSVYPYTVMALHRDREFKVAQVAFFKRVGWRRVAFIYEESAADQEYVDHFRKLVEAADGQIVAEEGVEDMNNLDFHLLNLKRQDARIILYSFNRERHFVQLFCQAYLAGMYGAKYVWIRRVGKTSWWLDAKPDDLEPCTQEQLNTAANSQMVFDGNQRQPTVLDLNFNGVKPLPEHYVYYNQSIHPGILAPYIYDGIIAIALALNASIADLQHLDPPRRLQDFSYSDDEMARVILKNADNLDFTGLLGRVLIKDGQRQTENIYVEQVHGDKFENVMIYKVQTQEFQPGGTELMWAGGHIPVDGITRRTLIQEISSTARITLFSLASLGSVMGLTFLFINIKYKHKRAIKMSSPSLSNLTVVGCLLLYASVFALGWDKTDLPDSAIVIKCHVERMLISLGLSLAFGSVFMKTYRIHAIFAVAVKKFKQIDLPDWKLISGVLMISVIDCVIFLLWITLDTTYVNQTFLEAQLDITEPEKEIFNVPVVRYCTSDHAQYFTMALYGLKGVLLTFGLFLAWETRNICISQLNDSKYIAASVYIVSLTIALTVPTMTILGDDVNMTYVIPSAAIVLVNTVVLCLNFIPKVYLLVTLDDQGMRVSMINPHGYGNTSKKQVSDLRSKLEKRQYELQMLCARLSKCD